ncbi:tRNA (guanosine(18)-2'-O)-methyltransferase [Arenibacter antarcticus]|uniref:TrmH family RNA methyltransferase n=1 Tax=Arenibacter antarcticus TaxID=2040469 RepID=A0ABW5VCX5_9FLAO|nr:RNA methyltransferase [Arenibacter sp. H213]MCM4168612.1 RNA methyltransferase [Arenibacter sp. H213]
MVVKSQIKFIKSLQQKKHRSQNRLFVAEGIKTVTELLASSLICHKVYVTDASIFAGNPRDVEVISEVDLKKMSGLATPNKALGVFHFPETKAIDYSGWVIALDDVRDPGNLGTIIRLCDWFGISDLICSPNTVDCYNPKTLQATMGSISRVNIVYKELMTVVRESKSPVYGTFMDGEVVYSSPLPKSGVLIMGNEANGISKEIETIVDKRISIPQFGQKTTDSLNVATATAILLSEVRRSGMDLFKREIDK